MVVKEFFETKPFDTGHGIFIVTALSETGS